MPRFEAAFEAALKGALDVALDVGAGALEAIAIGAAATVGAVDGASSTDGVGSGALGPGFRPASLGQTTPTKKLRPATREIRFHEVLCTGSSCALTRLA
jgi:hypothetical protein